MSLLPAVNSLSGPVISGTVQVPLAELDKMRSDHANAIKLAAELESKQKQIVITLSRHATGTRQITDYLYPSPSSRSGSVSAGQEVRRFESFSTIEELEVKYLNMDEVLETLKLDATAKVQKEIDAMMVARDKSEQELVNYKKKYSDANKQHTVTISKYEATAQENLEEIEELSKALKDLEKEYKKLSKLTDKIQDESDKDLVTLQDYSDQIDVLEAKLAKKSLWYRLFN